jgi:hypothetical protein
VLAVEVITGQDAVEITFEMEGDIQTAKSARSSSTMGKRALVKISKDRITRV